MSLTSAAKRSIQRYVGRLRRDQPVLITYLFHALFRDEQEIARGMIDPQQCMTVQRFSQFVAHYTRAGYQFISHREIERGMDPTGRYVMATFDDGYFNNHLALEVLEKHGAQAVFFLSTGHVKSGRGFWWDALYRARDTPAGRALLAQRSALKAMTTDRIEALLREKLGEHCLEPRCDIDRPFTIDEVKLFNQQSSLVHFANHTVDHAILTSYDPAGQRAQISGAQADLRDWLGEAVSFISYPNGNYDATTLRIASEAGLTLGITVNKHRNALPLAHRGDSGAHMTIGRFTLWGTEDIDAQCEIHRSGLWYPDSVRSGREAMA